MLQGRNDDGIHIKKRYEIGLPGKFMFYYTVPPSLIRGKTAVNRCSVMEVGMQSTAQPNCRPGLLPGAVTRWRNRFLNFGKPRSISDF